MKTNENGRSMIEMLGVLAIIGVLSVGGIYGYTVAMRNYRANEIVQTVSMLATMAHAANAGDGDDVKLSDSGLNTQPGGVALDAAATIAAQPALNGNANNPTAVSRVSIIGVNDTDICAKINTTVTTKCDSDAASRAGYCVETCS